MTIEQVIQAGEYGFLRGVWEFALVLLLMCVSVHFISHRAREIDKAVYRGEAVSTKKNLLLGILLTATLLASVAAIFVLLDYKPKEYREFKNDWVENTVKPYIEALPTDQLVFDSLKISGRYSPTDKPTTITGVPLTVVYLEDGVLQTTSGVFTVSKTLDSSEKPYMEYKEVKQNLGYGYNKGKHNIIIYVPKDYKFN